MASLILHSFFPVSPHLSIIPYGSESNHKISKKGISMYQVEQEEPSLSLKRAWQAAGTHIPKQGQGCVKCRTPILSIMLKCE